MARSARPTVTFTTDPVAKPLPKPEPAPTEPAVTTGMYNASPFVAGEGEGDGKPIPPQELCIVVFPVPTYKAITDEANKRGMSMNDALREAISTWILKGYIKS